MASLTLADRTHIPKSRVKNKNSPPTELEGARAKHPKALGVREEGVTVVQRGATQVSSER